METHAIDTLIAAHEFFRGLGESDLAMIAGCASNARFEPAQYLAREGEAADRFFAVRHGTVAIEMFIPQGGVRTIQTVSEGELIGWSWLFPPYRWQFSARAIDLVRVTSFDGACLRKKCDSNPALGYELMKRLAQMISRRLAAARLQLLDVYGVASTGR